MVHVRRIFYKIFSKNKNKNVNVIINDMKGRAALYNLEKFDVAHCAALQKMLILIISQEINDLKIKI